MPGREQCESQYELRVGLSQRWKPAAVDVAAATAAVADCAARAAGFASLSLGAGSGVAALRAVYQHCGPCISI